ncbi:MAG: hypothetical protein LV481_13995 [Methylacidiphilales bacterium]|nr:hypothetical protein [Candidatus Methylacidiphilales bacterium]
MTASEFINNLYLLQETLNGNLEVGSDLVRKGDIGFLFLDLENDDNRVDWEAITKALESWQFEGFIQILVPPVSCKEKGYCLKILRKITAVPLPANEPPKPSADGKYF